MHLTLWYPRLIHFNVAAPKPLQHRSRAFNPLFSFAPSIPPFLPRLPSPLLLLQRRATSCRVTKFRKGSPESPLQRHHWISPEPRSKDSRKRARKRERERKGLFEMCMDKHYFVQL